MAIVSTKDGAKKDVAEFPKLMTDEDETFIVLFYEIEDGVVIWSSDNAPYEKGYMTSKWSMAKFYDFDGTVTLSNIFKSE